MIKITNTIFLDESEIKLTFIRSPGPGGQNVNKVATAVLLRFDVANSSLPEVVRTRLLATSRVTLQNEIIIKGTSYRTQERNKSDAINRLVAIIKHAAIIPKKRKKTKPTFSSTQRRLSEKKLHGKNKTLRRGKFHDND